VGESKVRRFLMGEENYLSMFYFSWVSKDLFVVSQFSKIYARTHNIQFLLLTGKAQLMLLGVMDVLHLFF
jgi:hypothetical protein